MRNNSLDRAESSIAEISPLSGDRSKQADAFAGKGESKPGSRESLVRRYRWLLLVAAVVIFGGLYFFQGGEDAAIARPLTVRVEIGDIENAVTAAGTLQPSEYVDVGAQVSGQLEMLHVEVGDIVKAGDLVAEIDATVQMNRVEASRASLEALEAQLPARESALTLAKSRLERQSLMMAESATSQDDYDDAVDRLASAQASLTQLRSQIAQSTASLGSDEATLGYSKIYAPMDGTVVAVEMKEGQTLNAVQMAPTILRIADLTTMTVEAEVSEADVSKLTRGMDVYFTTLGGGERRWNSSLRQILPTPVIENNVVLYTALFDVENPDGALLTEMTAQVFFLTEFAQGVLKVPVAAVTYDDETQPKLADRPESDGPPRGEGPPPGLGAPGGSGRPLMRDGAPSGLPPAQPRPSESNRPAGPGRPATVRVVLGDGSIETRAIRVGVTSRISAEVLAGLTVGEAVVAGIVDRPANNGGEQRRPFGGPF